MARILIVDDSATAIASIRRALEPAGHTIDTLEIFVELHRKLRTSPPDLILLDLHMPSLPGHRFGAFVRAFESSPTPILIHSSRPLEEMEAVAKDLAAAGTLPKGAPPEEIRRRVRHVLANAAGPAAAKS